MTRKNERENENGKTKTQNEIFILCKLDFISKTFYYVKTQAEALLQNEANKLY